MAQILKDLWVNETDPELNNLIIVDPIELEELQGILQSLKSKRSSGSDDMYAEIMKYTLLETEIKYLNIINIVCWSTHKIPDGRKEG